MERSPSEADSHSASQEIPRLLWNPSNPIFLALSPHLRLRVPRWSVIVFIPMSRIRILPHRGAKAWILGRKDLYAGISPNLPSANWLGARHQTVPILKEQSPNLLLWATHRAMTVLVIFISGRMFTKFITSDTMLKFKKRRISTPIPSCSRFYCDTFLKQKLVTCNWVVCLFVSVEGRWGRHHLAANPCSSTNGSSVGYWHSVPGMFPKFITRSTDIFNTVLRKEKEDVFT
jgi:hypothetical protein